MLELALFIVLGILLGTLTGLVPGLHINNVLPVMLTIPFLVKDPQLFSIFIVCFGVSQIFSSYIPSIFLGAPEEDTALSVLPGHRMLHEGRGLEAIKIISLAGALSLFITIVTVLVFSSFFKTFYEVSRPFMHFILAFIIFAMIVSEKGSRKMLSALLIVVLSGFLGFVVLNGNFANKTYIMFPLLSGFFGLSTLALSISESTKIPPQSKDNELKISFKKILLSAFLGSLAGIAVGFLPAIGVSQAATFMQVAVRLNDPRNFLATLSGINIGNEIFSLNSLYLVGNPRSGVSVAIERTLGSLTFPQIILFFGAISLTVGVSSFFNLFIARYVTKILQRINYKKLSIGIFIFVNIMIFVTTGFAGLLVGFTSMSIGILCAKLAVRRTNCMGALLVPTMLFFAGLNPLIISILRI